MKPNVGRRGFLGWAGRGLALGAGSVVLGTSLFGQDRPVGAGSGLGRNRFTLARIVYPGGGWDAAFPNSDQNLIQAFEEQAGNRFITDTAQLTLSDPEIFRHPLLYLTGMGVAGAFTAVEADQLRRYLINGGFLFAADCGGGGTEFHTSVTDLVERQTFQEDPALVQLALDDEDHALFNMVVPFEDWGPGIFVPGRFSAWEYEGRMVAFLVSQFDYNCILASRGTDSRITQRALWQGTNALYYALTH